MKRYFSFFIAVIISVHDAFGQGSIVPTTSNAAKAYKLIGPVIESAQRNTSTIGFDDGVPLNATLAHEIYSKMSDRDKQRLKMPDRSEGLKPGHFGTLPIGGRYHKLTIAETDPEITSLQFAIDGSDKLQKVPVRLMKYSSAGGNPEQLCGDVIVVDTSNQGFHIQLENKMVGSREPKLIWTTNGQKVNAPLDKEYWRQDAPQSEFTATEKLYSTNLHTHGLHVSPEGHQDDIFLNLHARAKESDPPTSLPLVYKIKPDHVPGTFWYHSHLHHSAAYQVTNGLAGPLITVSKPNNRFYDIDDIPEVAAANVRITTCNGTMFAIGRVLLLQQFILSQSSEKTKNKDSVWIVDPGQINDRRSLKDAATILDPAGQTAEFIAVNGGKPLNITMTTKQVERWRFVCATKEASVPLVWFKVDDAGNPTQTIGDELNVVRIAEDGIPCLDTDIGNHYVNHAVAGQELEMFPGYRSDLLVQPLKKGTYILVNGPGSLTEFAQVLARITVDAEGAPMSLPRVEDLSRCVPENIVLPSQDPMHVDQTIAFEFADKEQFGVNGAPYILQDNPANPKVGPITQVLNQAERWELKINVPPVDDPAIVFATCPSSTTPDIAATMHPFHIHVNPFQVELPNNKFLWKDTYVLSNSGGSVHIRILPTDYLGTSVLHCHILDHEDQGMMRNIQIVPPPLGKKLLKNLVKRTAPESLFEKGKLHIAVVFSGPACEACNESLRQFQKVAKDLEESGTRITAISREKLSTPMTVEHLKIIDTETISSELPILVGSRILPSHAMYLIDKQGAIRYQYDGDHPIKDLTEVVAVMRELSVE